MEGGELQGGSPVLTVTDEEGRAADAGADKGARLLKAACDGRVDVMRALLDHPSADPAAMLMHADSQHGLTALMYAASSSHVEAMRVLLDHPAADPAAMMMQGANCGAVALTLAALDGHVDAMRLLLDHPAADAAAMMAGHAASCGGSFTALISAAHFAASGSVARADAASASAVQTLPWDCAPLLFLLRRVAVEPHPSVAQQVHMSMVMEAMCEGPPSRSRRLLDDDQPDAVREACILLLLEHGARFESPSPGGLRVRRELASWAWRFAGSD
jgi:hypothetical protein